MPYYTGGAGAAANGNLVHLAATGFDFKSKPSRGTGPLPAPQNLRVKTTGTSGEALCKCVARRSGLRETR